MPLLLLVLLLLPGCPDGDRGDFQGFLEVADAWGFAPENARGVCLFDADGDADLDVIFTQRESLRFYLNFGPEFFVEVTAGAGLDGDVGESPAGCGERPRRGQRRPPRPLPRHRGDRGRDARHALAQRWRPRLLGRRELGQLPEGAADIGLDDGGSAAGRPGGT